MAADDADEATVLLASQVCKLQAALRTLRQDYETKLREAQRDIELLTLQNHQLREVAATARPAQGPPAHDRYDDDCQPWTSRTAPAAHHAFDTASQQCETPRLTPEALSLIEDEIGSLKRQLESARAKLDFSSWEHDMVSNQSTLRSPDRYRAERQRVRSAGRQHTTTRLYPDAGHHTQPRANSRPRNSSRRNSSAARSASPPWARDIRLSEPTRSRSRGVSQHTIELLHSGLPTVLGRRAGHR